QCSPHPEPEPPPSETTVQGADSLKNRTIVHHGISPPLSKYHFEIRGDASAGISPRGPSGELVVLAVPEHVEGCAVRVVPSGWRVGVEEVNEVSRRVEPLIHRMRAAHREHAAHDQDSIEPVGVRNPQYGQS